VIDQRLYFFDKLHRVRLLDMIIERGFIDPVGVNIEQSRVPVRAERVNAQTTRFLSRRRNDFAQRARNSSFVAGKRVKTGKDQQFHDWFKLRLKIDNR
jgi:hypothetical protein